MANLNPSIQESWEFWKKIVLHPNGELHELQIRRELHDFYLVMQRVPKVYDHITGGAISKILTDPHVVIDYCEKHYEELFTPDRNDPR